MRKRRTFLPLNHGLDLRWTYDKDTWLAHAQCELGIFDANADVFVQQALVICGALATGAETTNLRAHC